MYHKSNLPCGIRVISEEITQVRSVSIGVWVLCGSRHEDGNIQGISHFLEHMLFKGTGRRTAFDIASAVDSIGGVMNAYTSKELISFYLKVPDYHLNTAIDLLADMFGNSLFLSGEIDKEKSVVLEEIGQLLDSPAEYVHDLFEQVLWEGQALGRMILGDEGSVGRITGDDLQGYLRSRFRGRNLIISAVGNLKHELLTDLIDRSFGSLGAGQEIRQDGPPRPHWQVAVIGRDLEQVHLVLGTSAPQATSEKRYAGYLINAMLGGCMSSRLFQEIREKRALAYGINSFLTPYLDAGLFGVYAGTGEERVGEVISVIREELRGFSEKPVPAGELQAAKELLKGNFLLSMESTDCRMTRLAKNEYCFGRYFPLEEILGEIDKVSSGEIQSLAQEMFQPDMMALAAVGRVGKKELESLLY